MNDVRKRLEARFPGLHARIEKMLVEAEARYNRQGQTGALGIPAGAYPAHGGHCP